MERAREGRKKGDFNEKPDLVKKSGHIEPHFTVIASIS